MAGNHTVGRLRRVGASSVRHGRCRACCKTLATHLASLDDAIGYHGHVGTLSTTGDLATSELHHVPAGVAMVKARGVGFDHRPRVSVTVGEEGVSKKSF